MSDGDATNAVNNQALKAPFPWFGGKRTVAGLVWKRLGNVDNYVEPFAGSLALLLLRPQPFSGVETVNDLDCYVANFWRATQHDPDAVAAFADGPVNEADLHSRHRWLVLSGDAGAFREKMRTDPDHFDARIAGWWCWGLCCWIGSGWCDASRVDDPDGISHGPAGGSGSRKPAPVARVCGNGVLAKGPRDGSLPQLTDAYDVGRGVHASPQHGSLPAQRPMLHSADSGVTVPGPADLNGTCAERRAWLLDWFGRLRDRLRNVRVCCGDWSRVCSSESVTTRLGVTGVFLDPPYSAEAGRSKKLYSAESLTVAHDVRAWCLERGADPMMRIALAGYSGEGHEELEARGWRVVEWKAAGGYGNRSKKGKANAKKERLWFSPPCDYERTLFDGLDSDAPTAEDLASDADLARPDPPQTPLSLLGLPAKTQKALLAAGIATVEQLAELGRGERCLAGELAKIKGVGTAMANRVAERLQDALASGFGDPTREG